MPFLVCYEVDDDRFWKTLHRKGKKPITILYAFTKPKMSGVTGIYVDSRADGTGEEVKHSSDYRILGCHRLRGSWTCKKPLNQKGVKEVVEEIHAALAARLFLYEYPMDPQSTFTLTPEMVPASGMFVVQGEFVLQSRNSFDDWEARLSVAKGGNLRKLLFLDEPPVRAFSGLPTVSGNAVPQGDAFWQRLGGAPDYTRKTVEARKQLPKTTLLADILSGTLPDGLRIAEARRDFRGQWWILLKSERHGFEWTQLDVLAALGLGFLAQSRPIAKPIMAPRATGGSEQWHKHMLRLLRPTGILFGEVPPRPKSLDVVGKTCCMRSFGCLQFAQHCDHIIPRERWGGPDDLWNLQPLCGTCHAIKSDADASWGIDSGPVSDAAAAGVLLFAIELKRRYASAETRSVPAYAKPVGVGRTDSLLFPDANSSDEIWLSFWTTEYKLMFQDCRGPRGPPRDWSATVSATRMKCAEGHAKAPADPDPSRQSLTGAEAASGGPIFDEKGTACVTKALYHCPF